jgi:DNA-binding winged helix-turn-helix (wHTH) protein/tetratricopeptide (TPR) repeat protein
MWVTRQVPPIQRGNARPHTPGASVLGRSPAMIKSANTGTFRELESKRMEGSSPQAPHIIRFGVFEVDLRAGELRKNGAKIRMQEQPFQILAMMLERQSEVVTREELRQKLWPADTFVDFEHGVNSAVARLRETLGDSADSPRYIETLPRRGYRFIASVEGVPKAHVTAGAGDGNDGRKTATEPRPSAASPGSQGLPSAERMSAAGSIWRRWISWAGVAAVLVGVSYFYLRPKNQLTESDSIVLADFVNSTADPVFDSTLRQALAVKLSESPFLNIVPEERIRETLRFMGRSPEERLTTLTAREVCQRVGGKAMLGGQIAQLGDHYSVILEALNCANGDALARAGAEATGKAEVLRALDNAATNIRGKLGESLSSIQKFSAPIENATTTSLEALKAYSLGEAERNRGAEPEAVPFFRRAIELDPSFAMAHAVLGQEYANLGESALAAEYTQKAFDRRERVSDQEKFYISSHYYDNVTHDVDSAIQTYELWKQTYPRDVVPRINLSAAYEQLGQADKALGEIREALRLDPNRSFVYSNLLSDYLCLDRFDEAKSTFDGAVSRGLDTEDVRLVRYIIAFLEGDQATMQQQAAWSAGKPAESSLLALEATTAAFAGRLHAAEDLFRRAEESARRYGRKESAAEWQALAALTEAEFGDNAKARQLAVASLSSVKSRGVEALAALALARAGDSSGAQALITELTQRFPSDTLLNSLWLPTIRAAMEIRHGNAGEAIRLLEPAAPYDLSKSHLSPALMSAFVRGEAYLRARDAKAAKAEFQKIVDHRGLVETSPHRPLALLGLARARSLDGDLSGSRSAYQDFLGLWKDADVDIPVLQQAKAEYAKLR